MLTRGSTKNINGDQEFKSRQYHIAYSQKCAELKVCSGLHLLCLVEVMW